MLTRREFGQAIAASLIAAPAAFRTLSAAAPAPFRLEYVLGSCMYGTTALAEIIPEVRKSGAEYLDLWPKVHGNQREQLDELGHDAVQKMLDRHNAKIGVLTRYDLGPFRLKDELQLAKKLGARLVVTGSPSSKKLKPEDIRPALARFIEQMQPHVAVAEECGAMIGIENHANTLLSSVDSLRWFAELNRSPHLGVALAPYHLPQDPELLAGLIGDLGESLVHFYAWEHGAGAMKPRPHAEQILQMPGRGTFDFAPALQALRKIDYRGWTEIFMHPVPRGVPICKTTAEVTAEVNRSRSYLEKALQGS